MLMFIMLFIPLAGLLVICSNINYSAKLVDISTDLPGYESDSINKTSFISTFKLGNGTLTKRISLQTAAFALSVSILMFALYDFSSNQFQFVQEYHEINAFNIHLGIDGLSVYFLILTTIIIPISLLSN